MRVISQPLTRLAGVALCVAVGSLQLAASPAGAVPLPDGRVYELVSPATSGSESNVFVPDAGSSYTSPFYEHGITTDRPAEVATAGDAVVYGGEPSPEGGDGQYGAGNGNDFLARRSSGIGWTATDLQVPGQTVAYQAFSSDLSVGIFTTYKPLAAKVSEGYENFYWHVTAEGGQGEYHPFYTGAPPNRGLF